ncbi:MAG: PAS domain S-box protein [Thermoanaerobaculia bacterium]
MADAALDVGFAEVFESAPDAYLLLAADPPRFTMLAANAARLRLTMTVREDVVGHPLFEVFPDNPDDPSATGVRNLQNSLREVLRTGKPHRMSLQRYDIRKPNGEFEERYWDPLNSPVFDERGHVIAIIHRVEDVTEQVRSGSRLRILESVVTTANDAVVVAEPDSIPGEGRRIVYVNEAFTRMTGYAPEEIIGKTARILQGPDTAPHALQQSRAAIARRESVRVELLNYRKDKRPFWVELSIAPVLDEDGRVVQWTSVQRDTSARREAEETALRLTRETTARADQEKMRIEIESILESITDAFFAVDRNWCFTFVNRRAEQTLRHRRNEVIGKSVWEVFPGAAGTIFEREYRRAMEEQTTAAFEAFYEPFGIWVETRAYPSPERLSVYLRDITKRKHAEEALRESEERYRLLIDMIPQNIWTTDAAGKHRYFSRGWYEFTGATPEESHGDAWVELMHPDDRERTAARWKHSLETGEPYEIEYRFRGADGEYRWFLGKANPLRDERGEIVDWFGTATDISERKRLDEQREQLLRAEREARAEADRERENLERVTESRAGLIRGFSHDVRNPLTVADMTAQLLELDDLSSEQLESIQRIRRSIRSSLRLIDDLLDVARAEAGELEIECVMTDVGQIVGEVAEDFSIAATTVGIDLELRAPRGLQVETDPARVRQIVSNLLSNAMKYAPNSHVTVDARPQRDGAPKDGDWIAVTVADTGPGIPPDKREAIFQEYTRLDPEAQQGAGIGLAISRRIARLLGGDLTVDSNHEAGATFTLWVAATRESLPV